jgi:aminotransferase in exopolysaccharide biosynthesis
MSNYISEIDFIKSKFLAQEFIPLHEPKFVGKEREYILDAIESTYVSSVGGYVDRFERMMAEISETKYAVATVNGSAALHMALKLSGVKRDDLVITQALTFVATANAISYEGAIPVFLDVDEDTMGLSPEALKKYLSENCILLPSGPKHKSSGRKIAACVPMHTFGIPCRVVEIQKICEEWNIPLVEDAAESIGSLYHGRHTGSFGLFGTFSFNGNKTLTCGGGGAIVTNDEKLAKKVKHITTQAKIPHKWEFGHDEIGYNYRMPNLNAAMACAQLEMLDLFVENKRCLALEYQDYFKESGIVFKGEIEGTKANYWLNAIQLPNDNGVMTRPIWNLMTELEMFKNCEHDELVNSHFLKDRIVNIPSSVRI